MGAIRSGAASGRVEGGVGEIVQVQGGHILRATGRKDRHSKVYTAKGPRDRRVRLSAHTAIQFYDVQDRLGYDRPSKAVDWLINNAKAAIDKLTELPPWHPNPNPTTTTAALVPATSAETNPMTNRQEELESSEFVPHQIGHSAMDMVINSRSEEDLGPSLHPFQTGPVSKWGLGFGFETNSYPRAETNRDGFVYSNNNLPSSAPFPQRGTLQSSLISTEFHGFDGFGTGSEDHHKDQAMVHHQSHFLDGRFGSDGFPAGFYVPINNEDECNVGSSKAPPSFYAWSNGGHSSLMKHK